jgi:hypothetical protein
MTDEELNRACAEVMGWREAECEHVRGEGYYYNAPSYPAFSVGVLGVAKHTNNCDYRPWKPATDANQALEVAEFVRVNLDARYFSASPSDVYNTFIVNWEFNDGEAQVEGPAKYDESFSRALVVASLMAWKAVKGGG